MIFAVPRAAPGMSGPIKSRAFFDRAVSKKLILKRGRCAGIGSAMI